MKKVAPDLLTRHRGNSCSSLQATPVLDEGQEEEQKKKKLSVSIGKYDFYLMKDLRYVTGCRSIVGFLL